MRSPAAGGRRPRAVGVSALAGWCPPVGAPAAVAGRPPRVAHGVLGGHPGVVVDSQLAALVVDARRPHTVEVLHGLEHVVRAEVQRRSSIATVACDAVVPAFVGAFTSSG